MLRLLIENFVKDISHDIEHPLYSCTLEKANSYAKRELSSIINDLKCLQANPETLGLDKLIRRLTEHEKFAGTREELEVAAHFKRNGFENLILQDSNNEISLSDIKIPLEQPIFIECYLQQYTGKEERLDDRLIQGDFTKIELSDEEVETLIKRGINDKLKQIEKSNDKPAIIILDFGYSESYEMVAKRIINEVSLPSFISCILIRAKNNVSLYNTSFNNESIKNALSSLPTPSDRISFLWQRPR